MLADRTITHARRFGRNIARAALTMVLCAALNVPVFAQEDGGETAPAVRNFPDYTLKLRPQAGASRAAGQMAPRGGAAEFDPPFSWDQTIVLRSGATTVWTVQGLDPTFNPVDIVKTFNPLEPFTLTPESNFEFGTVTVSQYDKNNERLVLQVPTEDQLPPLPFLDETQFMIRRGATSTETLYSLTVDVRSRLDPFRLLPRPVHTRNSGVIFKPGSIIRLRWTKVKPRKNEPTPEFKLDLAGATRTALEENVGLTLITTDLSVKIKPVALGWYHSEVASWRSDIGDANQRQRSSDSNGVVFQVGFGSDNLPPVCDALQASTFTPNAGQLVSGILPLSVDPETNTEIGAVATINYGDGTGTNNLTGGHVFAEPGVYKVQAFVQDLPAPQPVGPPLPAGPDGVCQDVFVVGGTAVRASGKGVKGVPRVIVKLNKQITLDEAGQGKDDRDTLTISWKDLPYIAGEGDRIVFCFNRNHFGRMPQEPDPGVNEIDDRIILKKGGRWSGPLPNAQKVSVAAGKRSLTVKLSLADLDDSADPRFGGVQKKGSTDGHLIGICIVPADYPSSDIVAFYMDRTDGLKFTVSGSKDGGIIFTPEKAVKATQVPGPLP